MEIRRWKVEDWKRSEILIRQLTGVRDQTEIRHTQALKKVAVFPGEEQQRDLLQIPTPR